MSNYIKIFKLLSRNDTGETNSHQSGISIPKEVSKTEIFPTLGTDKLNPRVEVLFFDENDKAYTFQYIYYNDAYFGKESRKSHNEYRLTCVKKFLIENNAKAGDEIWFSIDDRGIRHVGIKKQQEKTNEQFIKLGRGWHSIKI